MAENYGYADQLQVETPEQVHLEFPLAGVGSRGIALLLDTVIQTLVYVLLGLLIYVTSAYTSIDRVMNGQSDRAAKWLIAGFVLLNFVMFWGYFVLFEAFWKGQTPGKRVMKLRVLKDAGRSITLFEAMARNLLRLVDALPSLYLTGVVSMLVTRQHKRLGDLVAGTIVVHEGKAEQPFVAHTGRLFGSGQAVGLMPGARVEWEQSAGALPADAVAKLRPADLLVVETFFARALDLPVARRESLAEQVANAMCAKMGVERPAGLRAEQVLELVAWKMRGQG